MPARNRQWLSSTCVAALFVAVDAASAQTDLLQVRPGVTMPRGSVALNPGAIGGQVVRPGSGQPRHGHMRTHYLVRIPPGGYPASVRRNTTNPAPSTGYLAETPASLECIYQSGLGGTDSGKGCNPNLVSATVTGGELAIAVVDAFNYPTAAADLTVYDTQFNLPSANLSVIYAGANTSSTCNTGGTAPADDTTGWNIEAALEIEMAHAMAPSAHIYLVEANSASNADLFSAVAVAGTCVKNAGGGEVSMSFGSLFEYASETNTDSTFTAANVTYLASAGDEPGTEYPCTSPNVVCIGGTTISRDANGNFLSEGLWNSVDSIDQGTGGGVSLYESRPNYQNFLSSVVGNGRGVPDLAAIADPATGVWAYNSNELGGWAEVGGTSVAAPLFAGILNRAHYIFGSSYNALANNIYPLGQSGGIAPYVTNVVSGLCGPSGYWISYLDSYFGYAIPAPAYPYAYNPPYDPQNQQASSGFNWNMCTGWGSPKDSGNPDWLRGPRVSR
jgi:kumamolisin